MNCRAFQSSLDERLDERLSADRRAAFEEHRAGCPSCAEAWRTHAAAWQTLAAHHPLEPSFGFTARTLRRLTEESTRPEASAGWAGPLRWVWLSSALAVLALVVGLGYQELQQQRAVEVYSAIQQADPLEDLDVIANLHLLETNLNGDS